jgi:hypothetical protein
MNQRRELIFALGVSALVAPLGSFAQGQRKVWPGGVLDTTSTNAADLEALRKGLHEPGYGGCRVGLAPTGKRCLFAARVDSASSFRLRQRLQPVWSGQ